VAERLKALVLKTSRRASVSWVRIPPHPPQKRPLNGAVSYCAECGLLGDAGAACEFAVTEEVISNKGVELAFHAEG
jgi:hypothetical protein